MWIDKLILVREFDWCLMLDFYWRETLGFKQGASESGERAAIAAAKTPAWCLNGPDSQQKSDVQLCKNQQKAPARSNETRRHEEYDHEATRTPAPRQQHRILACFKDWLRQVKIYSSRSRPSACFHCSLQSRRKPFWNDLITHKIPNHLWT